MLKVLLNRFIYVIKIITSQQAFYQMSTHSLSKCALPCWNGNPFSIITIHALEVLFLNWGKLDYRGSNYHTSSMTNILIYSMWRFLSIFVDVSADLQPSEPCRCHFIPVSMDRSPGGDTLAGRWGGFEGRSERGFETEIGAREIEWRGDKGGKRKRKANKLRLERQTRGIQGGMTATVSCSVSRLGLISGQLIFQQEYHERTKERQRGRKSSRTLNWIRAA